MRIHPARRLSLHTIGISLVIAVSGCNNNEKAPVSQLAAKVNGAEISVHQINFLLGRSHATLSSDEAKHARREILDKLIDQQLAIEQALDNKLDRTPEVLMALEAGRREVLARAYIEQLIAGQTRPTLIEAKKYIAEHPALFAERRIFTMQEITLPAASKLAHTLRGMQDSGKTMDEIASWLKSKDIKFVANTATRAAEQVPLDLLPKLQALKDGQGLVQENSQNITLMRLIASRAAPVSESVALPRVQQFLGNQLANRAVSIELQQLKAKATISYQGEFVEATSASTPPPDKPSLAAPASSTALDPNIEKGVAGLK